MLPLWVHAARKGVGDHGEKVAICSPGGNSSPETKPAGGLISDFQCPELAFAAQPVVLVTAAEQRRTAVNSCPGAHGVPCCGCLHTSCPALPCPVSSTSPCPARDPKARVCFLDFVPSAQGRIPRTEWPDCSEHISRGNERFRRKDSGLGKVPGAETGVVRWKM